MILSHGFSPNGANICIYSNFTEDAGVIICLYVDDMLIFGTNMQGMNETNSYLTAQFNMKDLEKVDIILGNNVTKHSGVLLCVNPTI